MAIVIHTINRLHYAYRHTRQGKGHKQEYLGRVKFGDGDTGPRIYKKTKIYTPTDKEKEEIIKQIKSQVTGHQPPEIIPPVPPIKEKEREHEPEKEREHEPEKEHEPGEKRDPELEHKELITKFYPSNIDTTIPIRDYTRNKIDKQIPAKIIGKVDTTELVVAKPKVTKIKKQEVDINQFVGLFQEYPSSLRKDIRKVEVAPGVEVNFTLGGRTYQTAGHWQPDLKNIQLFSAKHILTPSIFIHEVGHGTWSQLRSESQLESSSRDVNPRYQAKLKILQEKRDRMQGRATKKLNQERTRLKFRIDELEGREARIGLSEQERLDLQADITITKTKLRVAEKNYDVAYDKSIKNYYKEVDALNKDYAPLYEKLNRFEEAADKEPAITEYTAKYKADKDRRGNLYTETFAEMSWMFLSPRTDHIKAIDHKEFKAKQPKLYEAFMDLVGPRIEGWSVPIKRQPITKEK